MSYKAHLGDNCIFSAIPTQSLEYDYPMPLCMYTIRQDEIDGPIVKYARVGDQIVHRWECQTGLIMAMITYNKCSI